VGNSIRKLCKLALRESSSFRDIVSNLKLHNTSIHLFEKADNQLLDPIDLWQSICNTDLFEKFFLILV